MPKPGFLTVDIIIFPNKNTFLGKKMHTFGGSLTAQALTSCPFAFRFLALPSDGTRNVVLVSLEP